jgi:magnesium transporter
MSLQQLVEILNKQKLVEDMVHRQHQPEQALVEALVQRQHSRTIQEALAQSSPEEIGAMLESLPEEHAKLLWQHMPPAREPEVLWEVSDALRMVLVGDREVAFGDHHAQAHELADGRLRPTTIEGRKDLDALAPIWVDLLNSTKAERAYVGKHFDVELPDTSEGSDLEVSARFRVEEGEVIHLRSNFLLDRYGKYASVPVAFVLRKDILFTVRDQDLPVFRLQKRRAGTQVGYVSDSIDVLLDLYGADVECSADALETIYESLHKVGSQVLREAISDTEAAAILGDIAEQEDLNGRIRSNILDTHRALSFLMRQRLLSPKQIEDARQIQRDIESLNSHTSFLFDKISFLMDATVGFVNLNQNKRVNQLTALGVVFMPINVLAGVGGMSEFSMMTQSIRWPVAYGALIAVMAMVGYGTYLLVRYLEKRKIAKRVQERTNIVAQLWRTSTSIYGIVGKGVGMVARRKQPPAAQPPAAQLPG